MPVEWRRTGAVTIAAAMSLTGLGAVNDSRALPQNSPVVQPLKASSVPTPKQFFGFEMGAEGKLAAFGPIKQYLSLLADGSPNLEYEVVGKTTEGEDFPVLRVSSPVNLSRLDHILDVNRRLADPAQMQREADRAGQSRDEYARNLAATSVPVYYIEAGIHSTEVGNTQALMDVAYRFATDRSAPIQNILDKMLILIVPSQNPDGHKKVIDYFNETAGTDFARVFPDLYQKYVGHDDNRDWFMFTQKETKIRVGLEQKYRPVVQHYMHWAGTNSPRIWSPPWDEPMSPTLDPLIIASSNSIGQAANRDLAAAGKTGAKTDDAYGIMWNADVMGYSTFQGTSTWLTEVAAVKDLAYTFTSDQVLNPSVATMRSPLPYDQKSWTLKQTVDYAKTALFSGLETVAGNPQQWLYNNTYLVNSHSETWAGGPYAYVISGNQRDPYAMYDLLRVLDFGKARIEQSTAAFTAGSTRYPRGSWILRTDQPMGRWIDQLLRIDEYPDSARKCDTCPLILPYSETTDNLGLLLGVDVDAIKDELTVGTRQVSGIEPVAPEFPRDPGRRGAYVLSPTSYGLGKVITVLEDANVPTFRAKARLAVLGRTLPPGAVLVPATPEVRRVLRTASAETGLPVYTVARIPKVKALKLKQTTRVGLVRGANNMPGGWLMWMFEQYGVDYQVVGADDYDGLAKKYDTIVLAPGVSTRTLTQGLDPARYPDRFHWARGVPDAPAKLAQFVKDGGNLVALGSASETARTALDLPLQNVTPTDRSTFTIPGALLKQRFNRQAPAAWGMPAEWPVWYNNDPAYRLTGTAQVAAAYPDTDGLLVSGYARGDSALKGATNVASFDVGKGHVTVAGGHITFRTWPRATWTVVTNAIYNGAAASLNPAQLQRSMQ